MRGTGPSVDTDLARFHDLAATPPSVDADGSVGRWADALDLVRGVPFTGTDYRWAAPLVARAENQIIELADRLAEWALSSGDPDRAAWPAERGLAGCGHPDDRLLAHQMRAGAHKSSPALAGAWREVTARLGSVGDAPSPFLIDLYERLRQDGPTNG